jgi:hypothetical protein
MIRFYSLFVTDDELLASPYVRRFNVFHDLTLHRGKTETVTFLLQTSLTDKQHDQLNVIYDPLQLSVEEVEVKPYQHQTLITVKITPKELGSIRLGFAFPQSEQLHRARMKKIHSPLASVPATEFEKHQS